jgi:cytochrome c biogenesis protein CcdA
LILELSSIPLAAAAGVLGILSPCVWPLVPVVMSSAAQGGRSGPWMLAAGLSLSFALAGTLLSFFLVGAGLDPETFRWLAGALLAGIGASLVIPPLGAWLGARLSAVSNRFGANAPGDALSPASQFGVGALLGLVWLPCVGPTLGAAIGLASMGHNLGLAFATMAAYGASSAAALLAAGFLSRNVLMRWRPAVLATGDRGKRLLGVALLLLAGLVLTGLDKRLETWVMPFVPELPSLL